MPRFRDAAEYVTKAKHRGAGHIGRRTSDRDVFVGKLNQLGNQLDTILEGEVETREQLQAQNKNLPQSRTRLKEEETIGRGLRA